MTWKKKGRATDKYNVLETQNRSLCAVWRLQSSSPLPPRSLSRSVLETSTLYWTATETMRALRSKRNGRKTQL
ncbi:hypothetical protein EUTSA_v10010033mg [Eutrema salsugineum]|uniref:Uncharacterized protein n=1 Tax=Eutrema salsugineum TaxID=72664 RepID=V4KYZ7_EUTSA|nr:hypothetical protein EUTSA_v10010033mg [Eutrema salsugineum]